MAETVPEIIWRAQELLKYCVQIGGGKNGSLRRITLSACDEGHARLTTVCIAGHGRPPVVTELPVSRDALHEIKDIFLQEGIYRWSGKTFSDRLIADKASTTYRFLFSDGDVSFSSQTFRKPYSNALDKLAAVIEKYQGLAGEMPTDHVPQKERSNA